MLIYYPAGDSAIIIKAGESISPEIKRVIRSLLDRVTKAAIPGVTDFIPSYNELMICYDDSIISYVNLLSMLRSLEQSAGEERLLERAHYRGAGTLRRTDLEEVAAHNKAHHKGGNRTALCSDTLSICWDSPGDFVIWEA